MIVSRIQFLLPPQFSSPKRIQTLGRRIVYTVLYTIEFHFQWWLILLFDFPYLYLYLDCHSPRYPPVWCAYTTRTVDGRFGGEKWIGNIGPTNAHDFWRPVTGVIESLRVNLVPPFTFNIAPVKKKYDEGWKHGKTNKRKEEKKMYDNNNNNSDWNTV